MSSAEGQVPTVNGGKARPESSSPASAGPERPRIAMSPTDRMASLASGGATTFLIGAIAAVVLGLFPIRLTNSQWQLGLLNNLVANGSWMLIGLVLLHLASMLQPNNGALNKRLMLWRRLAAIAAVGYLLIAPLQVVATWVGVDVTRNTSDRVISKSEAQLKAYRRALMGSANLTDLKTQLKAIPGAPTLPDQVAQIPYAEARARLMQQLDQAEAQFRQGVKTARRGPNKLELWRQTARGVLTSLLLAVGFASGAEGGFGHASLLDSIKQRATKPKSKSPKMPKPPKFSRPKGPKGPRKPWQFWR